MGTRLPHSRPPRRNSLCPLTKFPIIKTHSTSQKMAPGGPPGGARGRGGKFKKKEAAIARKKGKVVEAGDMPSSSEEESEDDDMPANPNHSKAARNQAKAAPASVEEVAEGVKDMSVGKG